MSKSLFLVGFWLAASGFSVAHAQMDMPPPADGAHHPMQAPRTRTEVETRVKQRFAALDTNKDGFITPDELHHRGMHRGADGDAKGADHKDRADRMFALMDTDKNGQISKAEFEAFHAAHGHDGPEGRARFARWGGGPHRGGMGMMHMRRQIMADRMFDRADANHDGKVSLAEAEKAALDRFDKIDTNHDGVISDAERDSAHQQMAARFHEGGEHRWGGGRWGRHGDTPAATPQG